MKQEVLNDFAKIFGVSENEPRVFFSPGRVNLIGEHIDYNGGLVMPCALNIGTYGAICKRDDDLVKLYSSNFDSHVEFSLDNLTPNQKHGWGNYPKGVISLLIQAGHKLSGFDMFIWGNLPNGAGLSSSASLNTLVALALNSIFELDINPVERAKLCQNAERFNDVNCGIMDPFACTMGKKDHAILLNCDTLGYEHIPLNLGNYRIVIADTNYKRGLADSKYNERRAECEQALADLKKVCSINEICELTPEDFEQHKGAIQEEVTCKRAAHAVYENYRTKEAARVLAKGELESLWTLMVDSHLSLRDIYEVVGDALDALFVPSFDYGIKNAGSMLGTRMTGAGFGGCTVSIVHSGHVDSFTKYVGDEYFAKTGTEASFYIAEVADGAVEI